VSVDFCGLLSNFSEFSDGYEEVYFCICDVGTELFVEWFGVFTEFGHIAANKDEPLFFCFEICEDFQCVFHGGGVSVVAVVYDGYFTELYYFGSHV